MEILLVVSDLGLGGAQQVVVHLANGLAKKGQNVFLLDVYPYLRKKEVLMQLSEKINLISPKFTFFNKMYLRFCDPIFKLLKINKRLNYNWLENQQIKQLKSLNKGNRIDVINSHVWWADKLVYDVLSTNKTKWIITMHGSYRYCISHPKEFPSFKNDAESVLARASGCIYISEQNKTLLDTFNAFQTLPSKKIWNGIPKPKLISFSRQELNISDDAFLIFCASRAVKEKGWEELSEAFIQAAIPNAYLLFAGDGPNLSYFKSKYNRNPNIQFLGFTDEVDKYISLCNICALPTYYKGEELPTFIIEAMAMGKPVLATDLGEIREMMTSNGNLCGKIIPLNEGKPEISEIKKALSEMFEDSKLLTEYSAISLHRSKSFLLNEMANKYIQFFHNIN